MNQNKHSQQAATRRKLKNVALFKEEVSLGASTTIPLSEIVLPKNQPRRYFDSKKLERLTSSIKKYGILENLIVRRLPNGRYELVAGERRYLSAKAAEVVEAPVVILDLSDKEAYQLSLVENLQREDLNPIEETEGILELLSMSLKQEPSQIVSILYRMQNLAAGKITNNIISKLEANKENTTNNIISKESIETIKEIFDELGKMTWESFIANRLPLIRLPEDIKEAQRSGKIEYTKALAIARIKDDSQRKELLEEAITQSLPLVEIRSRIKANSPQHQKEDNVITQMESTYKRVKKAKKILLENPKKKRKLSSLLAQIEKLIGEEI